MSAPDDARVLVAVSARAPADLGSEVAADLTAHLGINVMHKRGGVATEFLRELGPTIDCVVCVSDNADCVSNLQAVADSVPLVVYGDEVPPVPVDEIVATDGGTGMLARRVADRIGKMRKRDELTEANAKLSALNEYTRELTACETVDEVSDTVVSAVHDALGHGRVVLALRDGDAFYPYGHTLPSEPEVKLDVDEGIVGRTYQTGETQIVDDYGDDPDHTREVEGVHSVVSVPIGDRGVLQVTTNAEAAFDQRDAEFIEIVAAHTAEALSRIQREIDLRVERDRLHAFFHGMRAAAVYVESTDDGEPIVREINPAYEDLFGRESVGKPVSEAFPTDAERTLFTDCITGDEVKERRITRETLDGDRELTVSVVPVSTPGPEHAAFGLYAAEFEFY